MSRTLPLVVLFIVVPIAELALIIQVGGWIGLWPTLALLVADSVLGAVLMRSQGRAAWRRFNLTVAEGRIPAREVIDGILVIFGGALLLTPGFLTDIAGILLLLGPTRALLRALLARRFVAQMTATMTRGPLRGSGPAGAGGAGSTAGRRPGEDFDVEGTATEVDQERLRP